MSNDSVGQPAPVVRERGPDNRDVRYWPTPKAFELFGLPCPPELREVFA